MKIEIEIPDELARILTERTEDLSRAAVEALVLEGYRLRRLGGGQARRILGFATSMELHAFLKEHDVYLNYSIADLEQDIKTSDQFLEERRQGNPHAA